MSRRLPPFPVLLAIGLACLLLVWLVLGDIQGFRDTPPEGDEAEGPAPTRVEVVERQAQAHAPRLVLQGQLEAYREVALRARQMGRVEALPVALGERVSRGQTLLALAREELPARLAQAEAELALARSELEGAERLRRRELISNPDYLRLKSSVNQALAEVASLHRQLDDTRPEAPFDGVLDRLDVELGDLVQVGETWGSLVDDSRLTAIAAAPQREALGLVPGLAAKIRLLDGSQLDGVLSYVASRADDSTRSFPVEVTAANPERRRLAGASASLMIQLPKRQVHRLSPALLELNEDNQLAVKHLNDDDRVLLTPVELVSADADVARVAGLPDRVRLITLGGGFVDPGERVTAVSAPSTPAQSIPGEQRDAL
ncbi:MULTISPECIES: efflux RND transporter periplasmic adaptor subunit [Halomonas]|uniref:Multidrug efflux system membrane fusion protein n=1 Tax=Halomonas ventosae TaxID=229007 RepID=A0A4R6H5F6_9GAMM|nr:efflux RND transporter periplasmic adaptor subunit [Halomonas ventosae]TDO03493.1 multidrug efflux system membrane fusion protein [Halomonas ventosae]